MKTITLELTKDEVSTIKTCLEASKAQAKKIEIAHLLKNDDEAEFWKEQYAEIESVLETVEFFENQPYNG